jgi:hypothetical protein
MTGNGEREGTPEISTSGMRARDSYGSGVSPFRRAAGRFCNG